METKDLKDAERSRLFLFASVSLVVLTLGFIYLELYDSYDVPNFIRAVLALYWVYSVTAIFVSRKGSDKLVGKMCCNIFRSTE